MIHLFILICICIFLGLVVSASYIIYIIICSKTWPIAIQHIEQLSISWNILKPVHILITCIVSEPQVPISKKIQLDNYSIYLANVPHNISKKRLLLEMMCFIDLYYHHKRKQSFFKNLFKSKKENEKYYTAISEQAYIQVQWLLKSPDSIERTFCKELEIYLNHIRWTSNCLRIYNPNHDVIYFSSIE